MAKKKKKTAKESLPASRTEKRNPYHELLEEMVGECHALDMSFPEEMSNIVRVWLRYRPRTHKYVKDLDL